MKLDDRLVLSTDERNVVRVFTAVNCPTFCSAYLTLLHSLDSVLFMLARGSVLELALLSLQRHMARLGRELDLTPKPICIFGLLMMVLSGRVEVFISPRERGVLGCRKALRLPSLLIMPPSLSSSFALEPCSEG